MAICPSGHDSRGRRLLRRVRPPHQAWLSTVPAVAPPDGDAIATMARARRSLSAVRCCAYGRVLRVLRPRLH